MNARLCLGVIVALGCEATTPPEIPPLELVVLSPASGDSVFTLDSLVLLGEAQARDLGLLPDDSIWWTHNDELAGRGRRAALMPASGSQTVSLHARMGDRQASRSLTLDVLPGLGRVLWTVALDATAAPFLAFDDARGTLIAGDDENQTAVAIDLQGSVRWRSGIGLTFQRTPPAIGPDGSIIYGMWAGPAAGPSADRAGGAKALGPDGGERWSFAAVEYGLPGSVNYHSHGGVAIDAAGIVYLATEENDAPVYAINQDGSLRWRRSTGAWTVSGDGHFWSYATLLTDSLAASMTRDSGLSVVNADAGLLRWRASFPAGMCMRAAAVGSDGTIYVGTSVIRAFTGTGTLLWTKPLPLTVTLGSPVVGSDRIYFAAPNGGVTVLSLSGDSIATLGPQPAGGFHDGITLGANGTVYVAANDTLLSYDAAGSRRFAVPIPHRVGTCANAQGGPIVGPDGTLYLRTSDLGVMAIRDTVGPATDAPWPTLQGNFRRTGRRATDQ